MYMASVRAMNIALQRHTCPCANLAECRCAVVTTLGFMVACVAVLWCMMSWNFPMKLPHDEWLSDHFGSAKRSNWKHRHQNHHKLITNLERKLTTLNWRRIQGNPALNALCRPWIWTSCRKRLDMGALQAHEKAVGHKNFKQEVCVSFGNMECDNHSHIWTGLRRRKLMSDLANLGTIWETAWAMRPATFPMFAVKQVAQRV